MEHQIKELAEAMTNTHTQNLVQEHVKQLHFENEHLSIYVDNAAPLHEFESEEIDHHMKNGMEKVYGDITYEYKLWKGEGKHERENAVPHDINQ